MSSALLPCKVMRFNPERRPGGTRNILLTNGDWFIKGNLLLLTDTQDRVGMIFYVRKMTGLALIISGQSLTCNSKWEIVKLFDRRPSGNILHHQ